MMEEVMNSSDKDNSCSLHDKFLLAVHFEGLVISPKSSLHKSSLSKIWNTGVKVETNVKRVVKIQKSSPFSPGGRPDSLLFDTIYESEEMEYTGPWLRPSLVAQVENPPKKDCKIRINVYYSSSLSKDPLIMASTSFGLRDFLRSKKAVYKSVMGSEHCRSPIAYVRLLDFLPDTLHTPEISARAEDNEWNPLERKYIFQREENMPPSFCEERTAEARLSFKMPLLFLKNFASILSETIVVWTKRTHLERMRVGNFSCREEAYTNGWYEFTIAVGGCRINACKVCSENPSISDVRSTGTSRDSTSSRLVSEDFEVAEDDREILPSTYTSIFVEDRQQNFRNRVGRTNTEYHTLEPCYGTNKNRHLARPRSGTAEYRIDPSVNGNVARLVTSNAKEISSHATTDDEYEVITCEPSESVDWRSSQRMSVDWRSSQRISSADWRSSQRPPAMPKRSAFHIYVPRIKDISVTLQVEVEDPAGGKGRVLGNCTIPLDDVVQTRYNEPDMRKMFPGQDQNIQRDYPLHIVNESADDRWVVQGSSISVAAVVNQSPTQKPPSDKSPLSPSIPAAKMPDFENNSLLSSRRNHDAIPKPIISPALSTSSSSENIQHQASSSPSQPSEATRRPSRRISMLNSKKSGEYYSDEESEDEDDEDEMGVLKLSQPPSPASMPASSPLVSSQKRSLSPHRENDNRDRNIINMTGVDTSQLICDCYEWLWHLGYMGNDPLTMLEEETARAETQQNNLPAELLLPDHDSPKAHQGHKEEVTSDNKDLLPRADVVYSQKFLAEYVALLQNMFAHLLMLISACEEEVGDDCTFRPSRLKKEIEFQPLPINLHYQWMTVQSCSDDDRVKDTKTTEGFWVNAPNKNPVIVWDSVTCGAFSAHACGYKKGGLTRLLSKIGYEKDELNAVKGSYSRKLQSRSNATNEKRVALSSTSTGPEAEARSLLVKKVEAFEHNILTTVLRKLYTISQSLSVAVNSFIMKLELFVENFIHSSLLERWYKHGFLIVHECLLSVSGKEHAMIEDAWMAIEGLKNYRIRLLPSPQSEDARTCNSWLAANCDFNSSDRKTHSSSWWHSICKDGAADVYLVGREVQVFIPMKIVEQLPETIRKVVQQEGAIFNFEPVLFSQGIDIMQSLATTLDDIADFQLHINRKGVDRLNAYCERIQPCGTNQQAPSIYEKDFVPHPLTSQLTELMKFTDASEKNVQMLIEVERICSMVGGCRVTFCKSGKDRTGMAITLEQSRLLGEVFGTGTGDERIMRDANVMRKYGTRLMIAEKNIGRPVYAINSFQVKFLPFYYRPPPGVTENLIKSGDNS